MTIHDLLTKLDELRQDGEFEERGPDYFAALDHVEEVLKGER